MYESYCKSCGTFCKNVDESECDYLLERGEDACINCNFCVDVDKVLIDYERFKEVLKEFLADNLISEIINNMNDNDVFLDEL